MVEFIGFLISLVAILFLFFKGSYDARQRRKNPPYNFVDEDEEEEFDEDDPIREMIKIMQGEKEQLIAPPPSKAQPPKEVRPAAKPQKYTSLAEHQLRSKLEDHKLKSTLENRRLSSKLEQRKVQPSMGTYDTLQRVEQPPPRVATLLQEFGSLRKLVLAHEILSPPVALRNRDIPK